MTSGDEKDPPVPADLVGAPKRIRHEQVPEEDEQSHQEALTDDPNDGD